MAEGRCRLLVAPGVAAVAAAPRARTPPSCPGWPCRLVLLCDKTSWPSLLETPRWHPGTTREEARRRCARDELPAALSAPAAGEHLSSGCPPRDRAGRPRGCPNCPAAPSRTAGRRDAGARCGAAGAASPSAPGVPRSPRAAATSAARQHGPRTAGQRDSLDAEG